MISRLSKSTTEDLQFYTGFTMELIVKMVVVDEHLTFVFFIEKVNVFDLYFDPGVIWGCFRHRKSFFLSKNQNFAKFCILLFDFVIDVLIEKSIF